MFRESAALVLLRGPGGIGKSVAATQIATAFVHRDPNAQAVWVRLDTEHTGIEGVWGRILRRLLEARILPRGSLAERLVEGGVPALSAVVDALHKLEGPIMLVLDDTKESLSSVVEESLLEVLEQIGSLSLVITVRKPLPLLSSSKARLRIPITKLTHKQLHLSRDEITTLITLRYPEEPNPVAIAQQLYEQTQGWPLAVHGLLVERSSPQHSDLAPLDATHRRTFLTETVDRVLAASDPTSLRMFCLVAQYEEVSDEVLASALDISDDACQELLSGPQAENLDYWVDDDGVRWYQLHQLLAAELRQRIPSLIDDQEWRVLAGRLARAILKSRPRVAVQAAIIAQDWDLLNNIFTEGSAITLSRRTQPVSLSSIPEHVKKDYPVIAAISLIHEYAFPSGVFGRALTGFRALTSGTLTANSQQSGFPGLTAAILKMIINRITGNEKVAVSMASLVTQKMQELSDEDRRRYSRPLQVGVNHTAITYLHVGRYTDALDLLIPMRAWSAHLQPKSRSHATSLLAWATMLNGDVKSAKEHLLECEQLDTPVAWRDSYIGAGYRIASSMMALEEGDPDLAQAHLDAMREHESTIEHWPYLSYVQALIIESRSGTAAAGDYLESRRSRRGASTTQTMRQMLDILAARFAWQSGRVFPTRKRSYDIRGVFGALSRNDNTLALARAVEVSRQQSVKASPRCHAEVLLLQAVASLRDGDLEKAAEATRAATALMTRLGFHLPLRVVPQDVTSELAKLVPELPTGHATTPQVREIKPLTPAEQRALVAVVLHGSIPKAAEAMYLSRETVKGYMKQVYRKLEVTSREEAVKVAAEAGLLTEQPSAVSLSHLPESSPYGVARDSATD